MYELLERVEKRTFGEHFWNVSQRVQINFIFIDNVRIYRLWNSKFVGELFSNGIYHLLCSFVISTKDGGLGLPSLYRMHKLYKCPCKHCYYWICPMNLETSFQIIMIYSINGQSKAWELLWMKQVWILTNSKDM